MLYRLGNTPSLDKKQIATKKKLACSCDGAGRNVEQKTQRTKEIDTDHQVMRLSNNSYKTKLRRGGFATVHSAIWSDGPIEKWNIKPKQWYRRTNELVALKYADNSKVEVDYFLKEVESYFQITDNSAFIRCLGISQHPDGRYIIVLEFAVLGSLRSYLDENYKSLTWKDKITALFNISMGLSTLHKSQLIHHDFHSGNLLFIRDVGGKFLNISDLGQCKRDGQNELNAVIGILPYIAPEVLHKKKCSKAADIYSFAIVAYEILTGLRPHADVEHDYNFAIEIMKGLRPKIPKNTPKLLAKLIMECWMLDQIKDIR
ncbi:kinase-like domain-containing protein [Gigaspora rosea]|uniref:Kinase-like domain-containing protein n=1 Tax=Gigaspora rosea TaxID=44941 RepID=A0A397TYL7_9GLOM|nr:kinase-like domain-containing protein [Gigaspora rosea]